MNKCRVLLSGLLLSLFVCAILPLPVHGAESVNVETAEGASSLLTARRWSPYLTGICIGVLSWFTFLLSKHGLGVSTAYARTSGMLAKCVWPQRVKNAPYYQRFRPAVDWEWMLVLGLVLGAFASAKLSGDFGWEKAPGIWSDQIGTAPGPRWITALIGGIVMAIGARWAGGCTSGHGITGTLQLALSSWIAVFCFFIGGVATAMFIYRVLF